MKAMFALFVTILTASGPATAHAQRAVPKTTKIFESKETSLAPYFKDVDAGCLVLQNPDGTTISYNPKRCAEGFSPCSTFKIPNSLIGLETGVIPDVDHFIPWDGKKREREEWNRYHSLGSAIRHSVVWYYQELATRVGEARMKEFLAKIPYGNQDISAGLTTFWLASSLRITAEEQVAFLSRLMDNKLPFSQRAMDIVKEITIQKKWGDVVYRGKTGTSLRGETSLHLGWYVGVVTKPEGNYVFAMNISGEGAGGPKAREMCERILRDRGVLPPDESSKP